MMYFINPEFCLDDGTPAGVNVQLYSKSSNYWDLEQRFDTIEEALIFTDGMKPLIRPILDLVDALNYIPTHDEAKRHQ